MEDGRQETVDGNRVKREQLTVDSEITMTALELPRGQGTGDWGPVSRWAGALLLLALLAFGRPLPAQTVDTGVVIPMRDGVNLRADILRPKGKGPFPVLVYRTPYSRAAAREEFATFRKAAERGYVVVVQDVRGRYGSEGEFDAYVHEGKDGYDTIEWAATQPWSNGAVGTFGLSYPGAVQWLAAVEGPPHLKAMVPAMTFATPRRFFYSGGVWDLSWISWTWFDIAPGARERMHVAGPVGDSAVAAAWDRDGAGWERFLPLDKLPILHAEAPWYFTWLTHPPADPWWNWAELAGKYNRTGAAVLNFTGWHDEDYGPSGAIRNFQGLLDARQGQPANTHLIIGPWAHGVGGTGRSRVGQREMGSAAKIDYDETILRWMDHYLRGIDNGVDREPAVKAFVMGADRWIESDHWPVANDSLVLFLAGGGSSGRLDSTAGPGALSTFLSDPAHPLTDPFAGYSGAHNYASFTGQPGQLTFESPPLDRDLTVVGAIRARIFLSTTGRDTDLWVKVLDVAPDGTAWNLMNPGLDVMRASYRDESLDPRLLTPDSVYAIDLNELLTGNRFLKGHRIRVQLSAAFFPWFSRNLNTGESEVSASESRPAMVTIHQGGQYPSAITLPLVQPPLVPSRKQ